MDFNQVAAKWQKAWEEKGIFKASEDPKKKKCYVLEMYPYPSASFLHMGHVRNYTIGDVFARFKRMQGFNVLYPMGYDSFGLPAETAAKKESIHPKVYTEKAIAQIKKYQKALGNSYDWSRQIASHEPDYYRWNQYFFIKFFEKGLVYRQKAPVNFCETCQSVLANEEAESGKCWRCGNDVGKKDLEQWFFKITAYADQLLEDLSKIDWPEKIKLMQENWIGKSAGVDIFFPVKDSLNKLATFTTRCDTIFSVTFLAIAPESPLVGQLTRGTKYEKEAHAFVQKVIKEKIEDRINEEKEKEGIFTGRYAINPTTGKEIPIYISNFALMYGTGVVMCDAHDKRDFRFARKYNIPLKFVISQEGKPIKPEDFTDAFADDGVLFDSGKFSGMSNREALPKMADWLEEKGWGKKTVNYKIRDWMISRQRYWGTPIPMIHCETCGVVPVREKDLPVLLPEDVDFKSGSPLASSKSFVNTTCPKCGGNAKRDTDTMGGFMDSSWYFLRYCDPHNKKEAFGKEQVKYWMPVDQYIGGTEHAVMHLLYARFFIKALRDMGCVDFGEPFTRLFNQGTVYKDGAKMSKSKGNVVYQTDISDKYGIDTARYFIMSVSAPDNAFEWSEEGIEGSFRSLNKVVALSEKKLIDKIDSLTQSKMHRAIKDITDNIDGFRYNNALISAMEFANYLSSMESVPRESLKTLVLLLTPFTPHMCEEIWQAIGGKGFISLAGWPAYDSSKVDEKAEAGEEMSARIRKDIMAVIQITGLKPSKIEIIISPKWKYEVFRKLGKLLEKTRVMSDLMKELSDKEHGKDIAQIVAKAMKDQSIIPKQVLSQDDEKSVAVNARSRLADEFSALIEVVPAEKSDDKKASQAIPGKPAIVLK
jgi:leucyl-tRNA synthetase